jgi:hypothetical protein
VHNKKVEGGGQLYLHSFIIGGQVVSYMPRPFDPQVKRHWYPLERKLGGPANQYGLFKEAINLFQPVNEPRFFERPNCSPVTILSELSERPMF